MPKPETTEVELRNDTIEQLIRLLEMTELGVADFPIHRRTAVAGRLRQQKPERRTTNAVALCGLPGAGKSYVAEKLADVYDTSVIAMGDVIRDEYRHRHGNNYDSGALAGFAAKVRHEDAEQIPKWVTKASEDVLQKTGDDLIIIDGVRSVTDYEVLNDYYDDFYLIHLKAPFYKRLPRLIDRGREDEEAFGPVDLAERDEGELDDLGFRELREGDYVDVEMQNDGDKKEAILNLSVVVEEALPFEIANGKPLGLDDQLEEMRKAQAGGGVVGD